MELKNLQESIRTLAALPETDAPVISCYLTLEKGRPRDGRNALDERLRSMKNALTAQAHQDCEIAMVRIDRYLGAELRLDARGAAIFSRAGEQPFFLPLQFRVPLPTWLAVDAMPNIYHLVELKDTYHRYVVMIATEENVRILEVNLGTVTEELWTQRPELRKRVGREWTKPAYQSHRQDRTQKFLKEQIKILDQRMAAGGYGHVILGGHPTITGRVRSELPKHLAAKLIDVVPASGRTPVSDVVEATIAAFIAQEERESRAVVEELAQQIRTGGLAVAGTVPSFQALKRDQADTLVVAGGYTPGRGWACAACGMMDTDRAKPAACRECGFTELRDIDIREAMVRLAEQHDVMVEVVNSSEALARLGGVGCLLRYRPPNEYAQQPCEGGTP